VPVADNTAANGQVTAECFTYDGFNRLSGAWTVADATMPTCGTEAPEAVGASGWDASKTAYAAQWSYSDGGRITSLVKRTTATPVTSTYTPDPAHPAAVKQVTHGATTDSFVYDGAGRMVSRTVGNVTTALTWDVASSLVESKGQGGHVVYAYDASGQRVVQARLADANGPGTATAYVASGQVDDPNTADTSKGDTTATRYYTFGGSTVAVRTNDNKLSLMLGDEQGSTNVMMPVRFQTGGALESATLADAAASTRTSYTPYGELRGIVDNTATDRGWLGQVEDRVVGTGATSTGTGLTYLNARYYDPATSRFISPDPLMNPGNPRTLDAYRYADNNPVVFTDATGLRPIGQYDCAGAGCNITNHGTVQAAAPKPKPVPKTGASASSGGGKTSVAGSSLTAQERDTINFGDRSFDERHGLSLDGAGIKDKLVPKFIVGLQGYDQLYGEQNHGHVALDVAGFLPGVGVVPDAINAGWYCSERSWLDCGVSAVSMVPEAGDYIGYLYKAAVLAPVREDAQANGTLVAPIGYILRAAPHSTSVGSFPAYGKADGFQTRFDGDGLLAGYAAYDADGQLLLRVDINGRDSQHRATGVTVQTYGMTDGLLHPHAGLTVPSTLDLLPSGNY
jgi:RHS repeat-associated protein